jgi:hypothetical protein
MTSNNAIIHNESKNTTYTAYVTYWKTHVSFLKIILIFVSLHIVFIILLLVIIQAIHGQVTAIKTLRTESVRIQSGSTNETIDQILASQKNDIDTIESFVPDEDHVVDFIQVLDDLKGNGIIKDFSFASDDLVKDTLGQMVLPFYIELTGGYDAYIQGITRINSLPFLTRIVTVEYRTNETTGNSARIGGVLYVQKLSK